MYMSKNAYEVNDEILDLITGGKVLDNTWGIIDRAVVEAQEKGYPRAAVRAMLAYAYTQFPEDFSDNGSLKDIHDILKYFDKKWAEVSGK
jgi:hypothetical protein